MSNTPKNGTLEWMIPLYFVGAFFSALALGAYWTGSSHAPFPAAAALYILWGGLIVASAHLAVKKGREVIEGAVLGAFGPIGFMIEVLLPPMKGTGGRG